MKLLITGATGFIGKATISRILYHTNYHINVAVRNLDTNFPNEIKQFKIDGISSNTNWRNSLKGIDCIIHTAARVHMMSDVINNTLDGFREVNTAGTMNLARQAAKLNIKRFIYLSSIKVNGESTSQESPFTADDNFIPIDPYALSKYEAERGLLELAEKSQMEVVIIRPPLVYGPGVKANFFTMMKWLHKGIPLPFGAINNKRSLVAIDNLVDLILNCIHHPAAANQIFLVSDDEDLSTSELMKCISGAMGKQSRLLPVNKILLELFLKIVGRKDLAQRLCGSLQVDISKTKRLLNWIPSVSIHEGINKTTQYFLELIDK